ncbi:MAG: hypothetical protein SP1CHLAM54_05480 [Chlamydiia bacterium]|nr:hypothetical protein [Chlamydiia bacterium]MCH9615458.1 hypothetical protein [Chlamydiia bacterium]MCH9629113.1 hypothetical protein [Chlamydiia bacterium]
MKISGVGGVSSHFHYGGKGSAHLWKEIEHLRNKVMEKWDPPPTNKHDFDHLIHTTKQFLHHIKDFLDKHQKELEADARGLGWPSPPDPDSIDNFINSVNTTIEGFDKATPSQLAKSGDAVLVSVNEFLTQVHFRTVSPHANA